MLIYLNIFKITTFSVSVKLKLYSIIPIRIEFLGQVNRSTSSRGWTIGWKTAVVCHRSNKKNRASYGDEKMERCK